MSDILFAMPLAVRFFIAFAIVLALIASAAWVVRRFGGSRLGAGASPGRQPRIAVIDAATIDARRRLLLIRRDNTEHLLMIGGPSDIVIEPKIVRAPAPRESARAENGLPLQAISESPSRGREAEEHRRREPAPRPRTTDALERSATPARPSPELARAEPRPEPLAPLDSAADQKLANMASQLEAALRRAVPERGEPLRPPREIKVRVAPRIEASSEPKLDVKPESRPEPKLDVRPEAKSEAQHLFTGEPKREAKLETKSEPIAPTPDGESDVKGEPPSRQDFYRNLEQEMASLLGRPPGKS
jgi:flagellar protein FliO/FliZ